MWAGRSIVFHWAHAESLLLNIVLPDSTTLACTFKQKIKLLCFWSKVSSADLNGVYDVAFSQDLRIISCMMDFVSKGSFLVLLVPENPSIIRCYRIVRAQNISANHCIDNEINHETLTLLTPVNQIQIV